MKRPESVPYAVKEVSRDASIRNPAYTIEQDLLNRIAERDAYIEYLHHCLGEEYENQDRAARLRALFYARERIDRLILETEKMEEE